MGSDIIGKCWNCGHGLSKADYGREADCPGCHKATRVCRNCRQYAPGKPNDCAEPLAEHLLEKERANFCEHFDPSDNPTPSGAGSHQDSLLRAAQDLFKT
jgi:hypothetical protein